MPFKRANYKTIFAVLLALNLIGLVVGFFVIRAKQVHQQDAKFLRKADKFADGIAEKGSLSKQEILGGMLLAEHISRDHRASDQDLDKLIALIERGFAGDKSGVSLVDFGDCFDRKLSASPQQKAKIGRLCLKIAREATRQDCRVYALGTIAQVNIKSIRNEIPPFLNDSNPQMVKLAGIIIKKLDGAGNKAG